MANSPLAPTYIGFIQDTLDALVVFEACLSGRLEHVARRPHDRERQDLIRSGSVFIYEEHASGIKRWTDGVSWSPSRILGNFLVYREMRQPFAPGEKKRASRKPKQSASVPAGVSKSYDQRSRTTSLSNPPTGAATAGGTDATGVAAGGDDFRDLVGSLVDSYDFKPNSLVKKTISITYRGIPHHLVSYYTIEDVRSNRLTRPQGHQGLRQVIPRADLFAGQSFRIPIEEEQARERGNSGDIMSREMVVRDQYMLAQQFPAGYQEYPGYQQPSFGAAANQYYPPGHTHPPPMLNDAYALGSQGHSSSYHPNHHQQPYAPQPSITPQTSYIPYHSSFMG